MAPSKLKPKKKKSKKTAQGSKNLLWLKSRLPTILFKVFLLAGVFLVVFWFIWSFFLPPENFQQIKMRILVNPNDLEARLKLIDLYLDNHQFEEAEAELEKVLISPLSDLQKERVERLGQKKGERDPKEIRTKIHQWQEQLEKYPDYRDGWLELALLYLKLGQNQEARSALEKAWELDPNYQVTRDLEKFFQETD